MATEKLDLFADNKHDQHKEQHEEHSSQEGHKHDDGHTNEDGHSHDEVHTHDEEHSHQAEIDAKGEESLEAQIEHAEADAAQHGTGELTQGEVFPYLLGGLGNHREISFFGHGKVELPVIVYDDVEGFNFYGSTHAMEAAGTFTMHHGHPPITRTSDHEPVALDISITSLLVFQWLSIFLVLFVFAIVGRKYKNAKKAPSGFQNLMETLIIYVRDEIVGPNLPSKKVTNRLLPYFLGLFFFILFMNLIGLVPGGHTATGAVGTTAALAITAFFVINMTAMREAGVGAWFKHLLGGAPWWLSFIMVPIEIISMFVKPFALTIRLFANMTAGHVVLLSLVGLIFYFKSFGVVPVSVGFSLFMYALELLVAFLQAYIFTILTAVFTGLAIGDHGHEDHDHATEH
jgi:F-type H+-transporting ATPase subunit a